MAWKAHADSVGLQQALQNELTPGGAFALLVFFAFAMQCMSTIAVVRRETGGWKWPAVQFAYMTRGRLCLRDGRQRGGAFRIVHVGAPVATAERYRTATVKE